MSGGRAAGRPPDPEAERRILAAAQKLMATQGFSRMSIEAVAAESGVAKTTIYRRFSDKVDLAMAAIAELLPLAVPSPKGDSAYDDLLAQLEFNRRSIDMALPGALLAEEPHNPQLLETFREQVLQPRIQILRQILAAGIERGEIRSDVDFEAACDLILGTFLFHYLAKGRPEKDWSRRVVDAVWPALSAR